MINKIAAGEVVERPSSVVKELVENSIDASASAITIEAKDGGISFIRVTDNGKGIAKNQMKTAFLRHATSKIASIDDLINVMTLGFRGEALSSISSVAQIEVISKTSDDVTGMRIEIHGGEIISEKDIGCPEGTTFIMRNLFYNVPVRRNFLKKPATESGYIYDILSKTALGHPEIAIKYINNGETIFQTTGNSNLRTCVFNIYGKEFSKKMLDIDNEESDLRVYGLIGKTELNRANRTYCNFFINGRFVKSDLLQQAVEQAYKTRLPMGKFPAYVLNLSITPNTVDVNVHPTKLEVRFSDEDKIFNFITNSVNDILRNENLIPETHFGNDKLTFKSSPIEEVNRLQSKQRSMGSVAVNEVSTFSNITRPIPPQSNFEPRAFHDDIVTEMIPVQTKSPSNTFFQKPLMDIKQEVLLEEPKEDKKENIFSDYKIIGQIFKTYWIIEQNEKMYIIDQHAAHERILFEELNESMKKQAVASQKLLVPLIINLTFQEQQTLFENLDLMKNFGFDVEHLSETSCAIHGVPFILKGPVHANFFVEILDQLSETKLKTIYESKFVSIATIACKAAVKANDKLTYQEAKGLVEKLLKLENPFTCPHGRPTIIEMTKYELEKKFMRVL